MVKLKFIKTIAFIGLFLISFITFFKTSQCNAAHGISIDGKLKYPANFTKFDYASDKAKQGGDLILHALGSYDKMNPFTLKGEAPAGINTMVFESLAVASLDEPFAKYGLIAKDIELAADGKSVTFTINENARFSDNSKVTSADVLFSLETIKSTDSHPFYQAYFNDIVNGEILSETKIRFNFARKNRELHLIASELPVLSKKFYETTSFNDPSMTPPIGSGPYIIDKVNQGKTIKYKKNPNYWAKEHPVRKGFFNFNTITYKYFKDQLVSVEAFKAHEFDFMYINIAKQWVRDLSGPKFDSKEIIKELLSHQNNAGMQCFVMNLRKKIFSDRKVRQAIGLAFDFEWTNKSLFFNQYTQNTSYSCSASALAQFQPYVVLTMAIWASTLSVSSYK